MKRALCWLPVVAAVVTGCSREAAVPVKSSAPPPAAGPVKVTAVQRHAEAGHILLEITFSAENPGAAVVEIASPAVRLLAADGREIPHFFAPGRFHPALAAKAATQSQADFWAEESQAGGALNLEVLGTRVPVK